MSYILGIDIGTSNVKTVLVEKVTGEVCVESFEPLGNKYLEVDGIPGACERMVDEILEALENCMRKLGNSGFLCSVCGIGICGQMHGCVLWNDEFQFNSDSLLSTNTSVTPSCSHFITWQDGRCTSDFLSSLPITRQTQPISTGCGCATLSWLQKYRPESLQFTRAGTIMDLVVWGLCKSKPGNLSHCELKSQANGWQVVMSSQNAASWGYYDSEKMEWEFDILKTADFPVHLLPKVVEVPSLAGTLQMDWHNIPQETLVGIAMGDLQCSILATNPSISDANLNYLLDAKQEIYLLWWPNIMLEDDDDCVLNIGSASQIAVIQAATINQSGTIPVPLPSSIMLVPYFTGDSLLVAASLTGANALSALVNMLGSWMEEIGINRDSVPTESQLYEKLISLAREKMDTTLKVGVNFWGERLAPTLTGVVANVNVGNLSLGDIASATMKGIVENLHAMMPEEIFQSLEIKRLLGSGSVLQKNSVLCHHAEKTFSRPLEVREKSDAPMGAAMAMMDVKSF